MRSRGAGRMPRGAGDGSWLLPLTSGTVLLFAYPPFSVPILPFVGLVPLLLWLARPRTARELHRGGWAFAIPYFAGSLAGMFLLARFTLAGIPGVLGILSLHAATFFFFPIAVNVLNHVRPVPLPLIAPALWLVSEHARTRGDLYFPWVTLGYSPADWPLLIQHADLVGVYGISFWLVLLNALIAHGILRWRENRPWRPAAAALALVFLLPVGYGAVRWRQVERGIRDASSLAVAVVQPNVAQGQKWSVETASAILDRVNGKISEAEASRPDLVIGPEACLPMVVPESASRLPVEIASGTRPLLLGVVTGIGEGEVRRLGSRSLTVYRRHFNSAVLAAPDRTILGRHDKQFLVPVTEQIPYKEAFGFLLPLMRRQFGRFEPARRLSLLEVAGRDGPARFGVLICYESLFPGLVRRMRAMGAEFLVNITNDAWFGRTTFPYQHASFAVLRAIENRAAIVRCANTGVSAVFDPLGRQSHRTSLFREASFEARVPLTRRTTVYDRLGDVVLWIAYVGSALALAAAWNRHRSPPPNTRRAERAPAGGP